MSASALLLPRRQSRPRLALVLLSLLLLGGSLVHLGLGARWIAPPTVLQALLHYDPRNFDHRIIVDLRLVRLAAALLTGAALLFGGVMLLSSSGRGGVTPLRITLCGVALSAFASAVTAAILILDEQTLLAMRTWLAGDLAGLNWQTLRAALLPALAGVTIALVIAPRLNVLALGDKVALGLGVKIVQTRLLGLTAIALLCGSAVAVAGPIGFVGLVVPHAGRRYLFLSPRGFLNEKRRPSRRLSAADLRPLAHSAAPCGGKNRRCRAARHPAAGAVWPDPRQLPDALRYPVPCAAGGGHRGRTAAIYPL